LQAHAVDVQPNHGGSQPTMTVCGTPVWNGVPFCFLGNKIGSSHPELVFTPPLQGTAVSVLVRRGLETRSHA
jgi:hypothetical protein